MLVFFLLGAAQLPSLLSEYGSKWKIISLRWFLPALYFSVSVFLSAFVFRVWNFPLFDDAGFVLRYLDNFAKGKFFAFNQNGGPVFGLSSFSQGIFNGILCWTHLLTPDKSILFTAFLGLALISFIILKTLQHHGMKNEMIVLSFIVILFGSKSFLNSMTTGMETPVHLAIVLAAVYFFITNNSRWMWIMLSASVISKLDAVPLAVMLGAVHLFDHRKAMLPVSLKNKMLRELLFFVLIPVGAWIVFATAIFGSPLPQSAYAKMFFHFHADDSWFPFLQYFVKDVFRKPLFIVFLILFSWHVRMVFISKYVVSVRSLAFGLSFFSTLVLYYFYNPIEQMIWYYAMPDLFLIAQLVISFALIVEHDVRPLFKPFIIYFSFIAVALLLFYDTHGGRNWVKEYLRATETERIAVGKYLQSISTEQDTVIATHGHIARYTSAFVIDMTGLNSKLVTDYENDLVIVAAKMNPVAAVSHGTEYFIRTLDSLGYSLLRSDYDINEYYWPAWRTFSRKIPETQKTRIILPDSTMAEAKEVRNNFDMLVCLGDSVVLNLPDDSALAEVRFGIKRISRLHTVRMTVKSGSNILLTEIKSVGKENEFNGKPARYTDEVILKIDSETANIKNKKLVIASAMKEQLKIIEPLFLLKR
ncbi:MAG TPA: hypothetical protein VI757_00580 [Bacteroidia bacterium]|nr:hypothetical protein [Bacteroidia bacterium]